MTALKIRFYLKLDANEDCETLSTYRLVCNMLQVMDYFSSITLYCAALKIDTVARTTKIAYLLA